MIPKNRTSQTGRGKMIPSGPNDLTNLSIIKMDIWGRLSLCDEGNPPNCQLLDNHEKKTASLD